MSIETAYYLSQIGAVVIIVATLFALLWQAHQTNKIARADLTLTMWMQMGVMHNSIFDSPEKAEFMSRALDDAVRLSEGEKLRFNTAIGMGLGIHEAAFNLRARNLIETAAYNRNVAASALYMASPRVRKWWRAHRHLGYNPDFVAMIDSLAAKHDDAPPTGERPT